MGRDGAIGVLTRIELREFRDYLSTDLPAVFSDDAVGATPVALLCKELLRRGHRLVIFSLHASVRAPQTFDGDRLRVHLLPIRPSPLQDGFRKEREYLTTAIRRENPMCLNAHWTYEYALAAIESHLPHIITAHDAPLAMLRWNFVLDPYNKTYHNPGYYQLARHNAAWLVRTAIAYKAARNAHRLIAVSPYVADHLGRYGFHGKSIEVVPNGMPRENFARPAAVNRDQPFTFATVLSHWSKLKNGAAAIRAFGQVRRALPSAQMLMFGAGYESNGPAAAWARERSLDRGVEFRGPVPYREMIEAYSGQVSALVHPSFVEAHPMPIIEAMSLGIPVIAGNKAGGVPWTLGYGAHGALVDVRSPDAIASAMLRLAQDQELRTGLARAARQAAKEKFSLDKMVDRYEAIYAELIAGAGDRAIPTARVGPPGIAMSASELTRQ